MAEWKEPHTAGAIRATDRIKQAIDELGGFPCDRIAKIVEELVDDGKSTEKGRERDRCIQIVKNYRGWVKDHPEPDVTLLSVINDIQSGEWVERADPS